MPVSSEEEVRKVRGDRVRLGGVTCVGARAPKHWSSSWGGWASGHGGGCSLSPTERLNEWVGVSLSVVIGI